MSFFMGEGAGLCLTVQQKRIECRLVSTTGCRLARML